MRIVAFHAVADRRRMNASFDLCRVFIGVAGEAEFVRRGRDQLDVCDVAIHPDLVAAHAAHRHGRMHGLALGLVFVAGDAGGRIGFRIQRYGMLGGSGGGRRENQEQAIEEPSARQDFQIRFGVVHSCGSAI